MNNNNNCNIYSMKKIVLSTHILNKKLMSDVFFFKAVKKAFNNF